MKILVIGGCGFVGFNLAQHLSKCGHEVIVADNLVRRGSELSLNKLKKLKIKFIHCDIRNKEDFINLPKVDLILNCAAQPSAINYVNPEFDITNNTYGVVNILEHCRKNQTPIILWSTNKCYSGKLVNSVPYKIKNRRFVWDTPQNYNFVGWSTQGFNENLSVNGVDHSIYGVSKISSDLLVQEWSDAFKIPAICNRFSCLAGPNQWGKAEQGWVTWFAIANELGLPIEVFGFDGNQVRDCLFSDDLNNLIEKQAQTISNYFGEFFNVGGGIDSSLSVNEAIDILSEKNKNWSSITYHKEERRADQAIYISDTAKVQNSFNWKPTLSISDGYDQILSWVKNNKDALKELYA
jgi:CDP-paratose 2-epimerase